MNSWTYVCRLWVLACLSFLFGGVGRAGESASSATTTTTTNETKEAKGSKFRDPEDGWLDGSQFLDQVYGFVPLLMPITEPAVGYGVAGGLIFITRKPPGEDGRPQRPDMTAVGGLGTQNGTWGVFAGNTTTWLDDCLVTLVGMCYASVNLDYHGIGGDSFFNRHPEGYNLQPLGGGVEVRYRLGNSPVMAGLRYAMASTQVSFEHQAPVEIGQREFESRIGGLTPVLGVDTRDNFFTPSKGMLINAEAGLYSEALGGDSEFQRIMLTGIYYIPIAKTLTLGLRADTGMSFGRTPFYMRPSITLRGVAALSYQGQEMAQLETELRWQFWKRYSLVGFTGGGVVWNNLERFKSDRTVLTGGVGLRYEIARKYGLHMGIDVAFGPSDPALYVQFGSAWFRP